MAEGRMVMHKGAQQVPVEVLRGLAAPESLGSRHRPIPHIEVVEAILARASQGGLKVTKQQFAVTPDGGKFFGLFVLGGMTDPMEGANAYETALGVRNSTDQALALRGVAGGSVFICDNLALSGDEFVFARKNTTGMRLDVVIEDGFQKFLPAAQAFGERMRALAAKPVNANGAKAAIYSAFVEKEVAALRLMPQVHAAYFEKGAWGKGTGEFPEVNDSVLGLHHAFTRVFKGLPPTPQFHATRKLGEVVGL